LRNLSGVRTRFHGLLSLRTARLRGSDVPISHGPSQHPSTGRVDGWRRTWFHHTEVSTRMWTYLWLLTSCVNKNSLHFGDMFFSKFFSYNWCKRFLNSVCHVWVKVWIPYSLADLCKTRVFWGATSCICVYDLQSVLEALGSNSELIAEDELERMWKEATLIQIEIILQHVPGICKNQGFGGNGTSLFRTEKW
jgi:hypothetical protein